MNALTRFEREIREHELTVTAMRGSPRWTPDMDAEILKSKGQYRTIAALARRWSLTSVTVLTRWHILRAR
ncbi:hypothetical protein [uncultured Roseobacter sp.]|uniref:hypothetical protein n=1 Tax=uncultured Roseobacter sp. TaxID=114847 RepID=UPI00262A0F6F|nr:hypothetical protein [uncultured Roseobacter sp.]